MQYNVYFNQIGEHIIIQNIRNQNANLFFFKYYFSHLSLLFTIWYLHFEMLSLINVSRAMIGVSMVVPVKSAANIDNKLLSMAAN